MDSSVIETFLKSKGYPFDRITSDRFRSRFESKKRSFPFFVRVDPKGFLTVTVVPYLKSPKQAAAAERLYDRLLHINHNVMMAKFSIDDDLDIVLSVEYPSRELDSSEIKDAIDALSYYATEHYDELSQLAGA